jgi:hypothetical protein
VGPDDSVPLTWRLILILPYLAVTLAAVVMIVGERLELRPMLAGRPRNPAEAAVRIDAADLKRFQLAGIDASRLYEIRPGLSDDRVLQATPMEAAVLSRQIKLLKLVETGTPPPDAETLRRLECLAEDLRAHDIVEYLTHGSPAPSCEDGATIALLRKRHL